MEGVARKVDTGGLQGGFVVDMYGVASFGSRLWLSEGGSYRSMRQAPRSNCWLRVEKCLAKCKPPVCRHSTWFWAFGSHHCARGFSQCEFLTHLFLLLSILGANLMILFLCIDPVKVA